MTTLKDRYELVERIGGGAQALTWRAVDRETGVALAIKQLRIADMTDWKAHELFERETATLGALAHPAIPGLVDAFIDVDSSDPSAFLVMEFVEGTNLSTAQREGEKWSIEELERLLDEILVVLEYLHSRQPPIIHRDLKPSNIIRREDGRFVLVDFGAVQTLMPDAVGGSTVIGTSGYLPLEQLRGRAVPASDLYALGSTLVHLATGRDPNDLETVRGRLQYRELCTLPDSLGAAIDAMVEPHIEDRAASVEEVRTVLRRGEWDQTAPEPPEASALRTAIALHERPEEDPRWVDELRALDAETHLLMEEGVLVRSSSTALAEAGPRLAQLDTPVWNPLRRISEFGLGWSTNKNRGEIDLPPAFVRRLERLGLEWAGNHVESAFLGLLKFPNAVFFNPERTFALYARRPINSNDAKSQSNFAGVNYHIMSITREGNGRISFGKSEPAMNSTDRLAVVGSHGSVEEDVAEHARWLRDRAAAGDPPLILNDVSDTTAMSRYQHRHLAAAEDIATVAAIMLSPLILIILLLLLASLP